MASNATIDRVGKLVGASRFAEAARLLGTAAEAGDAEALAELARWRIAGAIIPRDLAAARALLRRAAEAGNRDAALLHAYFQASCTGGPDEWPEALDALRALAPQEPRARAQLRLIDAMELAPDGSAARPPETRPLSASPHVVAAPGFMTPAECAYLVGLGEPALQPSVVVDPATGRMIPHPVRVSDGTTFGVYAEDLVVNALNRRIAALSGTSAAQGEALQLLRYRAGGEYRAHMDALPAEANQRILTVLVYLSDGYQGGETRFLRTGLSFKGKVGDALLFRNVTADGRPDPMALHAGLPVTRGTKVIASRWIRQQPFVFPPPKPLLESFG
jgi:prolyl 4-hydroxylase